MRIADLRRAGVGVRAIAAQTAAARRRSAGNCAGTGIQAAASAGRLPRINWLSGGARPRAGKIAADEVLRAFVAGRLEKWWSPEQISRALRGHFSGDPQRHVAHETIYQVVYRPDLGCLASCRRGHCAREGGGAGRTARPANAARTGSPR